MKKVTVKTTIKSVKRRISRIKEHLATIESSEANVQNKTEELTYHAGWSKGYFEGRLIGLEDQLDDTLHLCEASPETNKEIRADEVRVVIRDSEGNTYRKDWKADAKRVDIIRWTTESEDLAYYLPGTIESIVIVSGT